MHMCRPTCVLLCALVLLALLAACGAWVDSDRDVEREWWAPAQVTHISFHVNVHPASNQQHHFEFPLNQSPPQVAAKLFHNSRGDVAQRYSEEQFVAMTMETLEQLYHTRMAEETKPCTDVDVSSLAVDNGSSEDKPARWRSILRRFFVENWTCTYHKKSASVYGASLKTLHAKLGRVWRRLMQDESLGLTHEQRAQFMPPIIVDVGAGDCGINQNDASDAFFFATHMAKHDVRVFAFEPSQQPFRWLESIASTMPAGRLMPAQVGLSSTPHLGLPLFSMSPVEDLNRRPCMFSLRVPTELDVRTGVSVEPVETVPVTSLDAFAVSDAYARSLLAGKKIFYVKIDVEGWDPHVIQGMDQLMSHGKVDMFSFEYGVFWNDVFLATAFDPGYSPPKSIDALPLPNLHSVVKMLDERGFDAFILGVGVCIPVTGMWWQDVYEFCGLGAGIQLETQQCVQDVLAIRRGSPLRRIVLDECNFGAMKWHLDA